MSYVAKGLALIAGAAAVLRRAQEPALTADGNEKRIGEEGKR